MPRLSFEQWSRIVVDRVRERFPTAQATRKADAVTIRVAERSASLEARDGAFWVRFARDDRKPVLPSTHDTMFHDGHTAGVAAANIIQHLHVEPTLGKADWAGTR